MELRGTGFVKLVGFKPGVKERGFILCCSIFCYGCMFASNVVFDVVFQCQAKRLAGKNVSEMTYFMLITKLRTPAESKVIIHIFSALSVELSPKKEKNNQKAFV